jgi:hypothetical protein
MRPGAVPQNTKDSPGINKSGKMGGLADVFAIATCLAASAAQYTIKRLVHFKLKVRW